MGSPPEIVRALKRAADASLRTKLDERAAHLLELSEQMRITRMAHMESVRASEEEYRLINLRAGLAVWQATL